MLLGAFFLVVLCGCQGRYAPVIPPAAPNVLRVVSSLPSRGQTALQVRLISQAIDLALSDAQGDFPSWRLEHITLDDGSDETGEWLHDREQANAEAAAGDASTVAYVGPYNSGAAMVSMPILNNAEVPQLIPSATWPGLTQNGWAAGEPAKYMPTGVQTAFRLVLPDSTQPFALVRWAEESGVRSATVLNDGSDYSAGMAALFAEACEAAGISVPLSTTLDSFAGSPSVQSTQAIFYAPSNPADARVLVASVALKHAQTQVYATDVALNDAEDLARLEGWRTVTLRSTFEPSTPQGRQFVAAYETRFGVEPSPSAAYTYDLLRFTLDEAKQAGRDRLKTAAGLRAAKNREGVSGTYVRLALDAQPAGAQPFSAYIGYVVIGGLPVASWHPAP